jgi:hypothetical protein
VDHRATGPEQNSWWKVPQITNVLVWAGCLKGHADPLLALALAKSIRGKGPNRDGMWAETGILESFPADGLKFAGVSQSSQVVKPSFGARV